MRTSFAAVRMTIHIHGSESWHHRPLAVEIVHRAHQFGLAGASVFHGVEGFGSSSVVHTDRLLSMSDELPLAIVIVDVQEKIQGFLVELDEIIDHGMITMEEVTVISYLRPADHKTGR